MMKQISLLLILLMANNTIYSMQQAMDKFTNAVAMTEKFGIAVMKVGVTAFVLKTGWDYWQNKSDTTSSSAHVAVTELKNVITDKVSKKLDGLQLLPQIADNIQKQKEISEKQEENFKKILENLNKESLEVMKALEDFKNLDVQQHAITQNLIKETTAKNVKLHDQTHKVLNDIRSEITIMKNDIGIIKNRHSIQDPD